MMYWTTAVDMARKAGDLTYLEWCQLYYNAKSPTILQRRMCEKQAHPILVRNGMIEQDVKFIDDPAVTTTDVSR